MNTKTLADDARALNLKVEIGNGKVRIEGPAADVKRVFVAQGLDPRREGDIGWTMWEGGQLAANICRMPKTSDYAYGYTVAA